MDCEIGIVYRYSQVELDCSYTRCLVVTCNWLANAIDYLLTRQKLKRAAKCLIHEPRHDIIISSPQAASVSLGASCLCCEAHLFVIIQLFSRSKILGFSHVSTQGDASELTIACLAWRREQDEE